MSWNEDAFIDHQRSEAAREARHEAIEDDLRDQHNGEQQIELYCNNKYVTSGDIEHCIDYAQRNDDDDYWTIETE